MTHRDRFRAIMNYQPVDRLPLYHFGYWLQTLEKWYAEGHISAEELQLFKQGGPSLINGVGERLGFDFYMGKCITDLG